MGVQPVVQETREKVVHGRVTARARNRFATHFGEPMGDIPAAVASALDGMEAAVAALEQRQGDDAEARPNNALRNASMALALNGLHLMLLRAKGVEATEQAKLDYERSLRVYEKVSKQASNGGVVDTTADAPRASKKAKTT